MLAVKFGPLMTAEEAKKRCCPHMMSGSPGASYKCIGDGCMAWMWLEGHLGGIVQDRQFWALKKIYDKSRDEGRRLGFCCK